MTNCIGADRGLELMIEAVENFSLTILRFRKCRKTIGLFQNHSTLDEFYEDLLCIHVR